MINQNVDAEKMAEEMIVKNKKNENLTTLEQVDTEEMTEEELLVVNGGLIGTRVDAEVIL